MTPFLFAPLGPTATLPAVTLPAVDGGTLTLVIIGTMLGAFVTRLCAVAFDWRSPKFSALRLPADEPAQGAATAVTQRASARATEAAGGQVPTTAASASPVFPEPGVDCGVEREANSPP